MCQYCKYAKTGDDYKPIVGRAISLGIAGEMACDAVIVPVIVPGDKGAELAIQYTMLQGNANGEVRVKINYCPMCGEKL